ncbi:MAG: DUF167 family protein [Coxiellaceae bacterium]|jgi:uncharacterized protein (TIGR00251 family)|nr:DUF167 family protein [Coxiellaceae bacterium]
MTLKNYYSWNGNSLSLELHIQTKARKNAIIGVHNKRLKIAITAAPSAGKANNYLIKFLATYFNVTQNRIKIIKGLTNKYKTVLISNPTNKIGFPCIMVQNKLK